MNIDYYFVALGLSLRFLLVVFVSCILSVCLSVSVCCVVDEIKIVIPF